MEKKFIPKRSPEELAAFFRKNGGIIQHNTPVTNVEQPVAPAPDPVPLVEEEEILISEAESFEEIEAAENPDPQSEPEADFEVMVEMEVEEGHLETTDDFDTNDEAAGDDEDAVFMGAVEVEDEAADEVKGEDDIDFDFDADDFK